MSGKKILIVDDEESVRKVLEKRLISAGYQVSAVSNGMEALERAKKDKPDLIILDVMMPQMSGGDVAQQLKQIPATKNIPIIFLTCLVTKAEEKQEGHYIGDQIFVAKPYNPQELLSEINKLI